MRKTLATIAVAALLGGCAVAREQQTVGQYVDDTTITSQVKAKFADSVKGVTGVRNDIIVRVPS